MIDIKSFKKGKQKQNEEKNSFILKESMLFKWNKNRMKIFYKLITYNKM